MLQSPRLLSGGRRSAQVRRVPPRMLTRRRLIGVIALGPLKQLAESPTELTGLICDRHHRLWVQGLADQQPH